MQQCFTQNADLFSQHRVGGLSLVLPLLTPLFPLLSALCLGAPHSNWVPGRGLLWGQLTIAVPWMTPNTEPPHSQDISRAVLLLGCGSHETCEAAAWEERLRGRASCCHPSQKQGLFQELCKYNTLVPHAHKKEARKKNNTENYFTLRWHSWPRPFTGTEQTYSGFFSVHPGFSASQVPSESVFQKNAKAIGTMVCMESQTRLSHS